MKKEEKLLLEKNIPKLYWMYFFSNAGFHLVIFTLFLLSKGFTMTQFFLIESAYFLVALLTEIPTGAFSDRISRKWSLIIASLISIPTMLVIILSNSFIVVLIAMGIGGLSNSFISGTDTSFLYDTLKSLKKEKEFKKVKGKMSWYGSWSGAIAGIIGGLIAQIHLSYPWWATFFLIFPALFIQTLLKEPPISKKHKESHLLHLKTSLKESFKGNATYFILYSSVIWLFFSLGFWLWQPYLKLTTLPLFFFGFFYAIERIISGFASKESHKFEKKLGMKNSLLFIPVILALAFIFESQFIFIFGFLFIFLQSLSGGFFGPILEDYIHQRIPSSKRATILSIKNMITSLLFVIFSPLLGYFIDFYSLQTALLLMGTILILVGFLFFIFFKKKN
ncbi:hypothetical protein CL618_02680 [archaeon]|nr:hypothetical protein [archaeon]|tara:strand:+ start:213 stop:1388 length:1176 start_codon:yes stop_codon:yes gene_type:complete